MLKHLERQLATPINNKAVAPGARRLLEANGDLSGPGWSGFRAGSVRRWAAHP